MKLGKKFHHDRKAFPPMRTSKELADEFGIAHRVLVTLLCREDAPQPGLKYRHTNQTRDSWYDPDAVRRWYAAICK